MTVVSVDPDGYVAAAGAASSASLSVVTAAAVLETALLPSAAMAGSDDAGFRWADEYDRVAVSAATGMHGLAFSLASISAGLLRSGHNYAWADHASAGLPGAPSIPDAVFPASAGCPAPPASAHGGTRFEPAGFEWVSDVIGTLWPDGDTGRLRSAAAAWDAAADALDDARSIHLDAIDTHLAGFIAPDLPSARGAVSSSAEAAAQLAGQCRDLAEACRDFADQIERVHHDTEVELQELLVEVGVTVGISVALTVFTGGVSDLVGAAAAGARVAVTVARITGWIAELGVRAGAITARIASIGGRFVRAGEIAASITARSVPFAAKTVSFGAGNSAVHTVAVAAVEGPDADLAGAAVDGLVTGVVGGAIGQVAGAGINRVLSGWRNMPGRGIFRQTGGSTTKAPRDFEAVERWAADQYDRIRASTTTSPGSWRMRINSSFVTDTRSQKPI